VVNPPPHGASPRGPEGSRVQMTRMRPHGPAPSFLLGEWCRDDDADGAPPVLAGYPRAAVEESREEVARAYGAGLRQMAVWLNGLTGLDRGPEEWEFVVYRFLTYLASEAWFRHLYLAHALRTRPGLAPVCLDPADFTAPQADSQLYAWYEASDHFNLQLFSQAARALAPDAPVLRRSGFDVVPGDPALAETREPFVEPRVALRQWIRRPRPETGPGTVALFPAHFPADVAAALAQGEGYQLAPAAFPRGWRRSKPYDVGMRGRLRVTEPAEGWVRGFLDGLRFNTPRDYLEELPRHHALAERVARRGRPAVIAGGFFRGVPERLWIQACHGGPRPSRLVVVQHGGNYGESADTHVGWTDIERRLADTFASWGWGADEEKVVPMPGPRLMSVPRGATEGDRLLIVSGMVREYPSPERFTGTPSAADTQERFLAALPPELLPRVRFRAHPRDGGTVEQQAPWHARFPAVSLDRGERHVHREMAEARLVVVNYPFSTTFPECVAADRPVLVVAEGPPPAHPRARDAYDRLHAAGVVHHDPVSAARAAAAAYADPDAWWAEPERRAAVEEYRRLFARTAEDVVGPWREFFRAQTAAASGAG
jgi:putative transferase (TIGR04331 family)